MPSELRNNNNEDGRGCKTAYQWGFLLCRQWLTERLRLSLSASRKMHGQLLQQDYDSLVYNAPRLIANLTMSKSRKTSAGNKVIIGMHILELKDLLNELSINHNQLIALAMLVGTDYNKGIYGIGQKKAVKLVQKYGNDFEKMFNELKWSDEYSWEEVFNHLKNMPVEKHYSLKWKKPDKKSMMDFLAIERQFNRERVNNALERCDI